MKKYIFITSVVLLAIGGFAYHTSAVLETDPDAPVITSLSPSSGLVGASVTIIGTGFIKTGNTIKFGSGYIKNFNYVTSHVSGPQFQFTVPEGLDPCVPGVVCSALWYPPVTPGSYPVSVINANGNSNEVPFTVTAESSPLSITTASELNTALVGQQYEATISATGGSSDYDWSVVGTFLPVPGLDTTYAVCLISPCRESLTIYGVPTQAGIYYFTLQVTSGTQTASQGFSITVNRTNPPLPLTKYFGYFGSDYIGSCSPNSCASEIVDHSNLAWIGASDAGIRQVEEASSLGMKTIINVWDLFFDGSTYRIRPNSQSNWDWFKQNFDRFVQNGDIVAIYPIDEPYHNGVRHGIPASEMKRSLEFVNSVIKNDYPNTPIAVIFAPTVFFDDNLDIPQGYDWVGFDCYIYKNIDTWDNCNGRPIPQYIEILKRKMKPEQKIVLVPDGQIAPGSPINQETINAKLEVINRYYQIAKNDDQIIAIAPYLWASYLDDGRPYTGVRDLPQLKERYKQIGKEYIGKKLLPTINLPSGGLRIITDPKLANGVKGEQYRTTITASGGAQSYRWRIVSGSLPPGLSKITAQCVTSPCKAPLTISGTPKAKGTYRFTLQVKSGSLKASQKFSITVNRANLPSGESQPTSYDYSRSFLSNVISAFLAPFKK